ERTQRRHHRAAPAPAGPPEPRRRPPSPAAPGAAPARRRRPRRLGRPRPRPGPLGPHPPTGRQGVGAELPPHPGDRTPQGCPNQEPQHHHRGDRSRMTYLDIHAIQTLPYSNINRDDLGSPKTLVYGGKERTRVSSQSWKRAVRHEVEARLGDRGIRTRRIISTIAERLRERGWEAELAEAGARQVVLSVGKSGIKLEKEKDGELPATSVLFYLPLPAIDELAAIAEEHRDAVAKEAAKKTPKGVLPADRITEVLKSRNVSVRSEEHTSELQSRENL